MFFLAPLGDVYDLYCSQPPGTDPDVHFWGAVMASFFIQSKIIHSLENRSFLFLKCVIKFKQTHMKNTLNNHIVSLSMSFPA